MRIILDTEFLEGLSINLAYLLLYRNTLDNPDSLTDIENKNFLTDNGLTDNSGKVTERGREMLKKIVSGNTPLVNIENLAQRMREIFPSGKKLGTEYYYRGNPAEIKQKLRRFFQLYGDKEKITEEEVITATERYVKDMEYDSYMRILKYFILKQNDEKDQCSDLYTWIMGIREGIEDIKTDSILI